MRSLNHCSAGPFETPTPPTSSLCYSLTANPPPLVPSPHPTSTYNSRASSHYPQLPASGHDSFPLFSINSNSLLLSKRSKDHVTQAIQSGLADSTLKRYSGTIKQYIRFCDRERIPEHLRFPADEFVLCAFAASSLGRHAGSTPRARLSALKAWHIMHNMEWKGSPRLCYVLSGVHNSAPGSSTRPPRPPINTRMLSQLIDNLNLDSPLDAAVAACATTAFWGQCRLGELLPASLRSPPTTTLPTRDGFKRSIQNPQSCVLRLPRTKTHKHGQDVVLVDQRAPINPVALLKNHIRVNNIPNDAYLFSYTSTLGPSFLSRDLFLKRCDAVWSLLGYPRTVGHSFRIGGTTELLIAGTPPDIVKVMGRWSSDSFLRYWRSLDALAPQYVRNLHTRRRHRTRL